MGRGLGFGSRGCVSHGNDAIDAHRLGDIFEGLFAHVLEGGLDLALGLAVGVAGDRNSARLGQGLEARGDVDPVAVEVVSLDHHVAQVEADAEPDPRPFAAPGLVRADRRLPGERAGDGIHHAGELHQEAVAHELHDASAVFGDQGLDDGAAQGGQAFEGARLVVAHEPGVAHHVGRQDCRQPAFQDAISFAGENRADWGSIEARPLPLACGRALTQTTGEGAEVVEQEVGLFQGREAAAAGHDGPALDVVHALDVGAWRPGQKLRRKEGAGRRDLGRRPAGTEPAPQAAALRLQ